MDPATSSPHDRTPTPVAEDRRTGPESRFPRLRLVPSARGGLALSDGSRVSLLPLDLEADLDCLHAWFNAKSGRFWGLQGHSHASVAAIYRRQLARPHTEVQIVRQDAGGQRLGLLEFYSPQDDGLSRHYPARAGDRGLHVFVAPGVRPVPDLAAELLRLAALHAFGDPAVRRIVADPDLRNHRALARFAQAGFAFGRVLYLPDKTARLVTLARDDFDGRVDHLPPRPMPVSFDTPVQRLHLLTGRLLGRMRRSVGI